MQARRGRAGSLVRNIMNDTDTDIDPSLSVDDQQTLTFESLGVSAELVKVLADQGINEPFAIQRLAIADALAGRDVCGKAKTGSGKTLAFGLPLLAAPGPGRAPQARAASSCAPPASWPCRSTTCSPRWPSPSAAGSSPCTAGPT